MGSWGRTIAGSHGRTQRAIPGGSSPPGLVTVATWVLNSQPKEPGRQQRTMIRRMSESEPLYLSDRAKNRRDTGSQARPPGGSQRSVLRRRHGRCRPCECQDRKAKKHHGFRVSEEFGFPLHGPKVRKVMFSKWLEGPVRRPKWVQHRADVSVHPAPLGGSLSKRNASSWRTSSSRVADPWALGLAEHHGR